MPPLSREQPVVYPVSSIRCPSAGPIHLGAGFQSPIWSGFPGDQGPVCVGVCSGCFGAPKRKISVENSPGTLTLWAYRYAVEIRNARCLLLRHRWLHYADPRVAPICRSRGGSITPVRHWLLYADHDVDLICRLLTPLLWSFAHFDVGVVQVDGGVGDQPAAAGFLIENDGLLAS